jgi:hypothetical protein
VFDWLGPDHHGDLFAFGLELLLAPLAEQLAPKPKSLKKRSRARRLERA